MLKRNLAAVLMSVFFAANIFAASEVVDQTIAVVNGEPIFASEFNTVLMPILEQYRQTVPASEQSDAKISELKDNVLNQKIDDILLKQEVKKQKIKVSKKELQDGIDQIKKRFANESEFAAELKKEGLTMSAFEKKLEEQLAVMKLVRQAVDSKVKAPTEADVRSFYDKVVIKMKGGVTGLSPAEDALADNLSVFLKKMSGEQIRIRQIFISSPKSASADEAKAAQARVDVVKKALQSGESFADVAGKFSEDPASKARNGDLGIVVKGDLLPEIEKKVFGMNVGEYTKEPIRTETGFHFIRVEEKRASKEFTFDEVKNDIGELLFRNAQREAYTNFMSDLRSKATIKINKTW
ncbi:MAG: SurA N-terminal domain-containing protein [Endomicrobia bacterium]|nr:SurA N-terminal domain-containing protein [Endomicrobiia bacterium]MCL2799212.1 SurA N-terminal domain-containing protein [Endomicrobiia bacterium]